MGDSGKRGVKSLSVPLAAFQILASIHNKVFTIFLAIFLSSGGENNICGHAFVGVFGLLRLRIDRWRPFLALVSSFVKLILTFVKV